MTVEVKEIRKNYFELYVNNMLILDELERSDVRYIIQELDNKISI